MNDIAISYGTYYNYLRPINSVIARNNIEPTVMTFNDGEIAVEFPDSIRGKHIFIFGDTTKHKTELEMTIDAARRSSAKEITVVLPYFGYGRSDKKGTGRSCIGSAVIATILESLGVNRIIAIDLHADQIQGNFKIPFEHISGKNLFLSKIEEKRLMHGHSEYENWMLCSPDAGGTVRVQKFADALNLPHVIMSKRRDKPGSVGSMQLIGDVKDKNVIIIDDMVDTGGTLIKAIEYLYNEGAKVVYAVITHPILSNNAMDKLLAANVKLITSNTRNTVNQLQEKSNIEVVNCYDILHQAIFNIADNLSIINTLTK